MLKDGSPVQTSPYNDSKWGWVSTFKGYPL